MSLFRHYTCDVCGAFREEGQSWFLITGNRWGNTVEVLAWDPVLAAGNGVRHVCSPGHAHAMMARWMRTGRLERSHDPHGAAAAEFTMPVWTEEGRRMAMLGQLTVDRTAILNDEATDRQTLMSVLDAIENVLQEHACDAEYDVERDQQPEPTLVFDA